LLLPFLGTLNVERSANPDLVADEATRLGIDEVAG
jgi:hypothetical protein